MTRSIKDVLQFCTDVVHRRPYNLDRLMDLLNKDDAELLTNESLHEVSFLLRDHYDLLVRFGKIFLPKQYRFEPWKDVVNRRVYCMLAKGDAMFKMCSLDGAEEYFNAIEAMERAERKAKGIVDDDPVPEQVESSTSTSRKPTAVLSSSLLQKSDKKGRGVKKRPASVVSPASNNSTRRVSRSRPRVRKFAQAVDFLHDLTADELTEFLEFKSAFEEGLEKSQMVEMILKELNLNELTPFDVLPTAIKKFKYPKEGL